MHITNNKFIIDGIKSEIQSIEMEISYLIARKIELEEEINLYEEDWHGYEYEKIYEIEKRINKLKRRKENLEDQLYELM